MAWQPSTFTPDSFTPDKASSTSNGGGGALPNILGALAPGAIQFMGKFAEPIADLGAGVATAGEEAGGEAELTGGLGLAAAPSQFMAQRALIKGALGALGQGGGEALREKMSGQQINPKNVASQAGQGALWAQLPGGGASESFVKGMAPRALVGAGFGAGGQAIQNIGANQPITKDIPSSGIVSGAINSLAPGLGKPLGFLAGTSKGIASNISRAFVGEWLSRNPEILKTLDLTDPLKNANPDGTGNLQVAAQNLWDKKLQPLLSSKTANLGEFIKNIHEAANASDLPTDVINRKLDTITSTILRKTGDENLGNLSTSIRSARSEAARNRAYASLNNYSVPLSILNDAKTILGKDFKSLPGAYSSARQFIENSIPEANIKELNKQYHNLSQASDSILETYEEAKRSGRVMNPTDWMTRSAFQHFGNLIGPALLAGGGRVAGNTPATIAGSTLFLLTGLKDVLQKGDPKIAYHYATHVAKPIENALRRLGVSSPIIGSQNQQINQ